MLRRATLSLLVLGSLLGSLCSQQPLRGSRPNILFVFSDDHATHAISAYGSTINTTPHIDRIASNGVRFANAFCGNAICGPSRATVLTGLHSHGNGFTRNDNTFDGSQPTLPKLLQAHGYQTAIVGKWHLGSTPTGFDHWIVLPGQGHYYNPDFLTKDGRKRIEGHVTDITTELAIEWLDKQRDPARPFVLFCQHKAPHRNWLPALPDLPRWRADADGRGDWEFPVPEPPTLFDRHQGRSAVSRCQEMEIDRHLTLHYDVLLEPTADERKALVGDDKLWDDGFARMTDAQRSAFRAAYAESDAAFRRAPPVGAELVRWKYQRYMQNYLACVRGVDRSVGALLDWLAAHPDVAANTVVVYSSDQGFFLGDHGFYDKRWMYEESLRMPLLVQWPTRIPAGRVVEPLVQNIDFAPTLLDLAGAPVPDWMHGRSLVPLLEGRRPEDWRDAIYYHYYESHAVHQVPAHYGVRTERYKLIHYYEPQWNVWELFDLQEDPDERRDRAADPALGPVRVALQRRLGELRQQYGDDTGTLGDGAFPITAGIGRVRRTEQGLQIWGNAIGGYLLHAGERAGVVTLRSTLRLLDGKPQQNGFLVVGGSDVRRSLWRAGIEGRAKRLVIQGPGGTGTVATAEVDWDGAAPIDLVVTIDLPARMLVAAALGARIEAALPPGMATLGAWGYGASNAETVFSALQ